LGVLSWVVFAVVNTPLGISTPISSAASLCATPILGSEAVAGNAYWTKFPFKWDCHLLFLVGTFLGSLLSVLVSRSFRLETAPSTWAGRFGGSPAKRLLAAFLGGSIIMFGARMAGGCTSGHPHQRLPAVGTQQLGVFPDTFCLWRANRLPAVR
jgi:uncharacterized membrane protein YedE/YeeE